MDRYTLRSQQLPSRKLTVETAYQGIWYIVSFAIAWIPWYCFAFDQIIIHGKHEVFEYLRIFTQPLQRVFNSLMYFRPKYLSARARYKTETRLIIALGNRLHTQFQPCSLPLPIYRYNVICSSLPRRVRYEPLKYEAKPQLK